MKKETNARYKFAVVLQQHQDSKYYIESLICAKQIRMRPYCYVFLLIVLLACGTAPKQQTDHPAKAIPPLPYQFAQPSARYNLPSSLREVSGLGWYARNRIVCVQDELGKVFVFDVERAKVVEQIKFGEKGDYEGVERVGDEIFVLRSDGFISTLRLEEAEMRTFDPGLPAGTEVEGLGYDARTNRLWLAVKNAPKEKTKPAEIVAYSFDLKTKTIWKGIFIPAEILGAFEASLGYRPSEFKPSGIAVQPQTGDVYLLASVGHRMLVLNRNGQLTHTVQLPERLLAQPEGICFAPDGTLYIASEAKDKKGEGYLLRFDVTASTSGAIE